MTQDLADIIDKFISFRMNFPYLRTPPSYPEAKSLYVNQDNISVFEINTEKFFIFINMWILVDVENMFSIDTNETESVIKSWIINHVSTNVSGYRVDFADNPEWMTRWIDDPINGAGDPPF